MRVKANCNINHNGHRYVFGDEFEISNKDVSALADSVTVLKSEQIETVLNEETKTEPKRRKKKD